jgi:hypothetical protein
MYDTENKCAQAFPSSTSSHSSFFLSSINIIINTIINHWCQKMSKKIVKKSSHVIHFLLALFPCFSPMIYRRCICFLLGKKIWSTLAIPWSSQWKCPLILTLVFPTSCSTCHLFLFLIDCL